MGLLAGRVCGVSGGLVPAGEASYMTTPPDQSSQDHGVVVVVVVLVVVVVVVVWSLHQAKPSHFHLTHVM